MSQELLTLSQCFSIKSSYVHFGPKKRGEIGVSTISFECLYLTSFGAAFAKKSKRTC